MKPKKNHYLSTFATIEIVLRVVRPPRLLSGIAMILSNITSTHGTTMNCVEKFLGPLEEVEVLLKNSIFEVFLLQIDKK